MITTIMTLLDLGLYWIGIAGGLAIGGVWAWIAATRRERRRAVLRTIGYKAPEQVKITVGGIPMRGLSSGDVVHIDPLPSNRIRLPAALIRGGAPVGIEPNYCQVVSDNRNMDWARIARARKRQLEASRKDKLQ